MSEQTMLGPVDVITHVDPRTLLVETNVRSDAGLTPEFIASIKQHGVLTPVLVHRTAEGLRVRAGQRRTLASIEAGRDTIPAYVVEGDDDTARRIIEQMVENDHRAALGDGDHLVAYQQLSLLGLSAATIAKRSGVKKARVETALTVAGSAIASAAASKYDLTLDQAAVIAEFDGDDEAVKDLTVCAVERPHQLEHRAQKWRDQRAQEAELAVFTADLNATGVRVVERPQYGAEGGEGVRINDLANLVDDEKVPLDGDNHAACEGRAVWVIRNYEGLYTVDVCTTPEKHVPRYESSQGSLGTGSGGGKMSEEQKAERRTIIANNKAWKSAEKVRRAWLSSFAQRKTTPKDGAGFVAARLVDGGVDLLAKSKQMNGSKLARALLGLPEYKGYGDGSMAQHVAGLAPARAQHVALVLVLAAIEEATGTHTWRHVGPVDRAYFQALAGWGYGLSEVEAILTAERAEPEPVDVADEGEGYEDAGDEDEDYGDMPEDSDDLPDGYVEG